MLVYWLWLQNPDNAEWKIPALGASFISCVKCVMCLRGIFSFFLDIGFFSARITVVLVYWLWLQNRVVVRSRNRFFKCARVGVGVVIVF